MKIAIRNRLQFQGNTVLDRSESSKKASLRTEKKTLEPFKTQFKMDNQELKSLE